MTSVETVQEPSPQRMTWPTVLAAWRGVTRAEIRAAFLLGGAYFLYDMAMYWSRALNPRYAMPYLTTSFAADQICAFTLMLCIVVADYVTGRDARRRAAYALAVVVSAAVAAWPEGLVMIATFPEYARQHPTFFLRASAYRFLEWLILGGTATFVYIHQRRARVARARMDAAALDRAHTARRTLESRLQAMQARVEPQFLFNTLAQVRDLYPASAARGERMLDELIAYLRAAVPKMRDTSSTVGQEIELVRAYLGIVRLRLGERLAFEIETREQIANARMPPMMLLPLVEHAIMHGLAGSQATGSIRIRTAIADQKLRFEISGNGDGFLPDNEGEDIAGIRERLTALYGSAASLVLQEQEKDATKAVLELPFEPADAAVGVHAKPSSSNGARVAGVGM